MRQDVTSYILHWNKHTYMYILRIREKQTRLGCHENSEFINCENDWKETVHALTWEL